MATEEVDKPPSLPQYSEMILAAIEALNDKNGANKSEISEYIESQYRDLPGDHSTLMSDELNRMKESGELIMVDNNYMKPDSNAPPKRGRGRPPKPKLPLPAGTVLSPPRPRGRPPKPRDPSAPVQPPPKPSSGSGRPRGRPPKKAHPAAAATTTKTTTTTTSGVKRGRGRPPKVKPAFAPAALA